MTAQAQKPPVGITVSKPKVTPLPPSKNGPVPTYPDSTLNYSVTLPNAPNGLLVTTTIVLYVYGYTDSMGTLVVFNPPKVIVLSPSTTELVSSGGYSTSTVVNTFELMADAGINIPEGATVNYAYQVTCTMVDPTGKLPTSAASATSDSQSTARPDNYTPVTKIPPVFNPFKRTGNSTVPLGGDLIFDDSTGDYL